MQYQIVVKCFDGTRVDGETIGTDAVKIVKAGSRRVAMSRAVAFWFSLNKGRRPRSLLVLVEGIAK